MKRSFFLLWALATWFSSWTSSQAAEQRVLLSFDNAGHRVEKILHTDNRQVLAETPDPQEDNAVVPDLPALQNELIAGFVIVLWLDDQGLQQASTKVPDPRLSHGPSHVDGLSKSRHGERSGAWLVTGPSEATQLLVLLPEDLSLGLGFEMWEVSLADY